ncbi:hypothetical protein [Brevibacillus sp. BC25]|uniref:hypothetical protein n=1 Tax=Brevibacillus sp. BC25 TaxID=1144308 RepID=UPI000271036A|nr:hypothetical protein [Brevibacillus sp. BC25]EJL31402.1 hypothetical protein PMI05_00765 [Brevibacillus sp. BC25]
MFINAENKEKAHELLKAYPSMKAAVEIFTVEKYFPEQYDFTEIDIANIEGNGTRGDIDGRGTLRNVVCNKIIPREESPLMILNYEQKCLAIERAVGALHIEGSKIIRRCFFEQIRDKHIYEFELRLPKSTYDFQKPCDRYGKVYSEGGHCNIEPSFLFNKKSQLLILSIRSNRKGDNW